MVHLGARAFEEIGGEVVQTTSFVLRTYDIPAYRGTYCRLVDPTTQAGKEEMYLLGTNRYFAEQKNYSSIGIFAVSTYNTDYILVKAENLDRAMDALSAQGYEVIG